MTIRPLLLHAVAATAARTGDAAAAVGLVLLATARWGQGGVLVGGLLTAALTAPHLAGGRLGRLVDRSRDARRPLALACATYAAALAVAVAALDAGWGWVAAAALVVAGTCGPLLTGGLSSLTADLGAPPARARGIDVLTYGMAGSAGPALVAALAVAISPAAGLRVVCAGVAVAGALVLFLPAPRPRTPAADDGRDRGLLIRVRPLRRVTVTTIAAAATGGALGVLAVPLASSLGGRAADGAWLVGALGLGTLAGSVAVALRPPRTEPVRASVALAGTIGAAYLAVALSPSLPVALAAYALVGVLTAPWVTATLAAREHHAPPGRRGQVFAGLAGWKIAAASAGTAAAGVTSGLPPRTTLSAGAVLVLVGVAAAALDRPRSTSR